MQRILRSVAAVVVIVALAGCSSTEGLTGGALDDESCAGCHGSDGGGGIGPAVGPGSDSATELDDTQIANVIRVGPGAMPSYGGRFSDAQVDSLVVYIRELQQP